MALAAWLEVRHEVLHMSMPGYAAEACLYRTALPYRIAAASGTASTASADHLAPQDRILSTPISVGNLPIKIFFCGQLGQACCQGPQIAGLGPLVACDTGLGCDIAQNVCVQPCGGAGQPCCDGPETRALKWTSDGKVYSPTSPFLRDMCDAGACDTNSHRCISCGTTAGGPCCPPDAEQATARCVGAHLECQFDSYTYTSGTCRACGTKLKPPCHWGCDPGLGIRNGLCDVCGDDMQPPCDDGCHPGLEKAAGLCRHCGASGQIPCDRGCNAGLGVKGGICSACGGVQQQPCDKGCNPGLGLKAGLCALCGGYQQPPCDSGCHSGLSVVKGVCGLCGAYGQVPCDAGCNPPYKPAGGICRSCGAYTQPPCDQGGCNAGLVVESNQCVYPPPCANIGDACVPDNQSGTHCCQTTPAVCTYGTCKACVPHGQECQLYGTQLCCDWRDNCVLDQSSEKVVCNISS